MALSVTDCVVWRTLPPDDLGERLATPMVPALRGKEHVEWDNRYDVGMPASSAPRPHGCNKSNRMEEGRLRSFALPERTAGMPIAAASIRVSASPQAVG